MFRPIQPDDWPAIDAVQRSAYRPELREALDVLQRKVELSPASCFVYEDDSGSVAGYCLAHGCQPGQIPELNVRTDDRLSTDSHWFLHDMALSEAVQGRGLARQFVTHLLSAAEQQGIESIALVAVQGSAPFWQKQGFVARPNAKAAGYGADARYMVQTLLR